MSPNNGDALARKIGVAILEPNIFWTALMTAVSPNFPLYHLMNVQNSDDIRIGGNIVQGLALCRFLTDVLEMGACLISWRSCAITVAARFAIELLGVAYCRYSYNSMWPDVRISSLVLKLSALYVVVRLLVAISRIAAYAFRGEVHGEAQSKEKEV